MNRNQKKKVQFSVLTTVYNKADFLAEAIESVLNQSYDDFEVIIVDDCSTDGSDEIAKRYSERDSRIKFFKNQANLGDYPNRNRAIELASNEYLKFLDADDVMEKNALAIYASVILKASDKEPLFYVNCQNSELVDEFNLIELDAKEGYRWAYIDGKRLFSAAPNSCLYRKSVIGRLGMFKNERQTGDYEMAHRLTLEGPVGIVETPKALSVWRLHENQESLQIRTEFSIGSDYIRISLAYLDLAKEFFSHSERHRIRRTKMLIESQQLRSAIGRLQMKEVYRVCQNLNFPLLRVFPHIFRPFKDHN